MGVATERRPSSLLAPYVEALWLVPREAYADNGLTVLPVGHASLALPLDGSPILVRPGVQPVAVVRIGGYPNRIIWPDVIFQAFGHQGQLATGLTFDKSLHSCISVQELTHHSQVWSTQSRSFHTASVGCRPTLLTKAAIDHHQRLTGS